METSPQGSSSFVGDIKTPAELTVDDRAQMFSLMDQYFANLTQRQFSSDLNEKEWVILIRRQGHICGFSTLMRLEVHVDGRRCIAIYSGDTIVEQEAWMQTELHRVWASHIWNLRQSLGDVPVFWFLVSCGYRTYRFLPVFFRRFYPTCDSEIPLFEKKLLDLLGAQKFASNYCSNRGTIRFPLATPLRPPYAEVSEQRRADKHVRFYLEANPGHVDGEGLACLAEIGRENLTRAAERLLRGS